MGPAAAARNAAQTVTGGLSHAAALWLMDPNNQDETG
jgi:hypothetical protein